MDYENSQIPTFTRKTGTFSAGQFARRLGAALGWTRSSTLLLSGFLATVALILYVWWPLAEEYFRYVDWAGPWWLYMDWLLIRIFLVMSLLIVIRADLRLDALTVFVGLAGGLVIESWGTQTSLWTYYTAERPPLWIIPAWPIASLSIDRLVRLLKHFSLGSLAGFYRMAYWAVFGAFFALMLVFVSPTFDKSFTTIALVLVAGLILTPVNPQMALLTFLAGSGLGYYLELWGTTRECWTYYTLETPPLFAVLAHGMAAVAFWRAGLALKGVWMYLRSKAK